MSAVVVGYQTNPDSPEPTRWERLWDNEVLLDNIHEAIAKRDDNAGEIVGLLADLSDCGFIRRIAETGVAALEADAFARLARIADELCRERDKRMREVERGEYA